MIDYKAQNFFERMTDDGLWKFFNVMKTINEIKRKKQRLLKKLWS